ncbi:hypothetical protein AGABI1DRAFT_106140 [Agaricus bisporus var. burnettii JB137-S8]|uniref:Uncharacterized protein n=1 Tax=Agaricus bisporus var. burnettii (strain JB137-S8 / ATCC MYA-4627 / FGSC 10392) TaxID=597362 RepID=K5WWA8_AGABU|nr:uncharacterized protein AGABI1DRAFT_106140 [Agaricus bisporus var. burnettii JB137-S8]EKM79761.1 hypothetical protein AGABI1DRAFT_106140 [Agaricus bisporus var. burnettii JB137-S8]
MAGIGGELEGPLKTSIAELFDTIDEYDKLLQEYSDIFSKIKREPSNGNVSSSHPLSEKKIQVTEEKWITFVGPPSKKEIQATEEKWIKFLDATKGPFQEYYQLSGYVRRPSFWQNTHYARKINKSRNVFLIDSVKLAQLDKLNGMKCVQRALLRQGIPHCMPDFKQPTRGREMPRKRMAMDVQSNPNLEQPKNATPSHRVLDIVPYAHREVCQPEAQKGRRFSLLSTKSTPLPRYGVTRKGPVWKTLHLFGSAIIILFFAMTTISSFGLPYWYYRCYRLRRPYYKEQEASVTLTQQESVLEQWLLTLKRLKSQWKSNFALSVGVLPQVSSL